MSQRDTDTEMGDAPLDWGRVPGQMARDEHEDEHDGEGLVAPLDAPAM